MEYLGISTGRRSDFDADGSRWMWRDADVRSWSSDTDIHRRYGKNSAGLIVGSAVISLLTVVGATFAFLHGVDNFTGASILALSSVTYLLMWASYFLFARRLHAAVWFAPLWVLAHIPAAVLTMLEIRRVGKLSHKKAQKTQKEVTL